MFQKPILLSVLALPLLAAVRPVETYDLRPRFTEGMQLIVTNTLTASVELDEASATVGDFDILEGGVSAEAELEGINVLAETIEATRDGSIAVLRRTVEESKMEASGDFDGMGESSSMNESEEDEFVGRTLILTVDEEGEVAVEDVSEGDFEPLDEERLATQNHRTHFEQLLPTAPVEVGDSWDPSESFLEEMMEELRAGAEAEGDSQEFEQLMEVLSQYGTAEATGTLESVKDGVATIRWSMEFGIDVPDLMDVIGEFDDAGEMPEEAEASMALTMDLEGTGEFDLRLKQLTSFELEGSLAIEAEGALAQEGMEMQGSTEASGAWRFAGSIEVVE